MPFNFYAAPSIAFTSLTSLGCSFSRPILLERFFLQLESGLASAVGNRIPKGFCSFKSAEDTTRVPIT